MDPIQERDVIYKSCKQDLSKLAYKALHLQFLNPLEFVLLCIDVDDPSWTDLLDYLMPNGDWQSFRNKGERPISQSIVKSGICDYIGSVVPDAKEPIKINPPDGFVRVLVVSNGGVSLYYLEPSFLTCNT
jgi:hypothetical protein